jgi:hypothetical protein
MLLLQPENGQIENHEIKASFLTKLLADVHETQLYSSPSSQSYNSSETLKKKLHKQNNSSETKKTVARNFFTLACQA